MGTGWYVRGEKSGAYPAPHGGRALLFAQYHLEEFAGEFGLPPLKEFVSANPVVLAAYLRSQGVDPESADLPEEEWFDPADALPTIGALLMRLADDPGPVASLDKVRGDLQAMSDALRSLQAAGERFHIASDMPDLTDREPPTSLRS
ncbi:MAG: hypothetical protein K1X57_07280 [Gemmataceae bacterium]|nr:hypothetical protein [Gemmataceae bacterium]